MVDYFQLLTAIAVVFVALYYYFTSTFNFWKNLGVPGPEPVPIFGTVKDVLLGKCILGSYVMKIYKEYKNEPLIGIFVRRTPVVIVKDLDLVKDVLIKDFSTFSDRGMHVYKWAEPLSAHLFNLEPERWRPLRLRLTPVFTSGKLKEMFSLILECSNRLEDCLDKIVENGGLLDCREVAARFTTDVIGSCAFGINMNALSDEESEFRRIGRNVFRSDRKKQLQFVFKDSLPWLYDALGLVMRPSETTTFLTTILAETMKYRKENNIVRPDFVNMLMELKNNPHKLENVELTDDLLAAQAFAFFAAGFETSSTTIGNALYEMALNPDLQDKLRKEIEDYYVKNNGNWTYDDVKSMPYLDKVFKETLRKYPPGTLLRRVSQSHYTFSNTKISIPKDTSVLIPVHAIHVDPNIYPNPDVFDPERFNKESEAARHPMSFLPFGDGPRNCIGARFAVHQTKVGLIKMLKNFKVDACDETLIPYVIHRTSRILSPERSLILKISKVKC